MTITMLKRTRNLIADFLARLVAHYPFLERPLTKFGRLLCRGRYADSFYRETRVRLSARLTRTNRDVREFVFGPVTARFSIGLFTTHMHYFMGLPYEPNTTQILLDRLKSGDVFVDIGANHGFFSVIAGHLVGPEGKVIAFEPNPSVFRQLRRCVSENGLHRSVTMRAEALSDNDSELVRLYVSPSQANTGLSSLFLPGTARVSHELSETHYVDVKCRSYDSVHRELALGPIRLLKIDVEGAEHLVLSGMEQILRNTPPQMIVIETNYDGDAYRQLLSHGYQARRLECVTPEFGNFLFERSSDHRLTL